MSNMLNAYFYIAELNCLAVREWVVRKTNKTLLPTAEIIQTTNNSSSAIRINMDCASANTVQNTTNNYITDRSLVVPGDRRTMVSVHRITQDADSEARRTTTNRLNTQRRPLSETITSGAVTSAISPTDVTVS